MQLLDPIHRLLAHRFDPWIDGLLIRHQPCPCTTCTSLTGVVRIRPVDQSHVSREAGRTDLSSAHAQ
jgi:hypothetical protein